jgi:nitroreductase
MKNSVIDSLISRRSIRAYQNKQITPEELDTILEAGKYSASGRNRQSAIMIAVQDAETVTKLSKMNAEIMGTDTDPFYGAPTVVIVLADKTVSTHFEDGCLVMGNLMNAAHAIGVDSCWIHRARQEFESAEGKEMLRKWGVENAENYVGIGHCILGYRACDYPAAPQRKENYVYKV